MIKSPLTKFKSNQTMLVKVFAFIEGTKKIIDGSLVGWAIELRKVLSSVPDRINRGFYGNPHWHFMIKSPLIKFKSNQTMLVKVLAFIKGTKKIIDGSLVECTIELRKVLSSVPDRINRGFYGNPHWHFMIKSPLIKFKSNQTMLVKVLAFIEGTKKIIHGSLVECAIESKKSARFNTRQNQSRVLF